MGRRSYEIESFSKLQTVIESLRGNDPQVFYQVTLTFNPWNEHHWLKREFSIRSAMMPLFARPPSDA
nr:phage terminase large subunit [Lactiplantibacillus argentoratensis]